MVDVHDQIAGAEGLRLGQEILGPAALARLSDQPVAKHVLLRDDGQPIGLEPVFQRPDGQVHATFADPAGVGHRDRLGDALVLDQAGQPFACAFGIGRDQDGAGFTLLANMVCQCAEQADLFLLSFRREIAPDAPARIHDARPGGQFQRVEPHHPAVLRGRNPGRIVQVQQVRRRGFVD